MSMCSLLEELKDLDKEIEDRCIEISLDNTLIFVEKFDLIMNERERIILYELEHRETCDICRMVTTYIKSNL